jgi:TonB family protein
MKIVEFGGPLRNRAKASAEPLEARNSRVGLLVGFAILAFALGAMSPAQQVPKNERKLVTRVEPEYPPVLKMRQIGGTVRLEVTITAKGAVKGASLLGGNPILAESAIAAVKKWVYAPADTATTTEVSLEFNPYR